MSYLTEKQIRKIWVLLRQVKSGNVWALKEHMVLRITEGRTKSLRAMQPQEAGRLIDWLDELASTNVLARREVALRQHIAKCFSAAGIQDVDAYLLKRGMAKKMLRAMQLAELEVTHKQAWAVYHRQMKINGRLLQKQLAGSSVTLPVLKRRGRKAT